MVECFKLPLPLLTCALGITVAACALVLADFLGVVRLDPTALLPVLVLAAHIEIIPVHALLLPSLVCVAIIIASYKTIYIAILHPAYRLHTVFKIRVIGGLPPILALSPGTVAHISRSRSKRRHGSRHPFLLPPCLPSRHEKGAAPKHNPNLV